MKASRKGLAIAIQQLLERFNLKVNLNQAVLQSSVPLKKSDYFEKSWQDVGSIFGRNCFGCKTDSPDVASVLFRGSQEQINANFEFYELRTSPNFLIH